MNPRRVFSGSPTATLVAVFLWLSFRAPSFTSTASTSFAKQPVQDESKNDQIGQEGRASGGVLLEAESLARWGGWKLDTQFIDEMGSPYLLAHGLGRPVADAVGRVRLPGAGRYRVHVRTKDWVARWRTGDDGKPRPPTSPDEVPGRFRIAINDTTLPNVLGNESAAWAWQVAGEVDLPAGDVEIRLLDQTGFDGRCDAIYLQPVKPGGNPPPNETSKLAAWRKEMLGIGEPKVPSPASGETYDLVVIGGGYSGMGAAISAARAGCKVALVQNRLVLGGNGSSEVRVWAKGEIRRGKYPRIGEIIEEIADSAKKSPGTYEEFEDAKKEKIVRAEPNIDLFLGHHAFAVTMDGNRVGSVDAFEVRNGQVRRFVAPLFVDATGHGTIGALAGADREMTPKGRMGMSNMWAWAEDAAPREFPETPWALDLTMRDFPYPRDFHGQWFWESGFDKDPLADAEGIRDWNLRAVFGAFNAMKNRDGADKHVNAYLTWIAYIGGPRESRRLLGDVVLTEEDIVTKRVFPDGTAPSTWSVDLHYPKKQYAKRFPDNPFISVAVHGKGVDRTRGYPIPYRCFYSRNIENLFMAGRCISVTHEALGTVRVMKTCGMMGEVVGKAASVCRRHDCLPRDVYHNYWGEMDELLQLPGQARRDRFDGEFVVPENVPDLPGDFSKWPGVVVDDETARLTGRWTRGAGLAGYLGLGYRYAGNDSDATAEFEVTIPEKGKYDARVCYRPHPNRAKLAPVSLLQKRPDGSQETLASKRLDQTVAADDVNGFVAIHRGEFQKGDQLIIRFETQGAGGLVHIDAVQLLPVDPVSPASRPK